MNEIFNAATEEVISQEVRVWKGETERLRILKMMKSLGKQEQDEERGHFQFDKLLKRAIVHKTVPETFIDADIDTIAQQLPVT